ncbi:aldehyde dehydrogenase family protein [Novosphingobium sediminicola]|uniref:Acyl-CoA reductase-like NAD-dependent aldehyde dehydrogenase n=1 Tax=Novosphingobium sediminicola TaxID=563162 RepID=A0A7W6CKM1_9SPHN|nr:aldehyde dehydrogenase family protein [Novosphingobium sediminicola]MBB3957527.1 acyl-CoA reductase-like NAD-dependent aldehyde dehydrogenase [Novosphingobium sediminicola]
MDQAFRLLIDGALVDGVAEMPVINPATGRAFATAPRADAGQLDAAVASAGRAFPGWAGLSYAERRAFIERFADGVEVRFEELARLMTMEQGKPLVQARGEVGGTIAGLRYFAAQDIGSHVIRDTPAERITEHRSPLGVVAAITPWNFPLILLVVKLAPALITGNVVIAKPAPTTPLTTLLLGEVAADILPPGVFQTLADANDLGAALTSHPGIAHVSFTGSTATGKKVLSSTVDTLKRFTLELGGNDAALVLDDADVAKVAPAIFGAAMVNAGQVCLAAKRVYAPRAMYDDLCDALGALARAAVVGEGLDQDSQIGPVQNSAQYAKLIDYLAEAREQGKIVAGGAPLEREGYFIAPTIVRDLPDDARLVREEQFGPVLPVLPYDDLGQAIAAVNASEYGLGGTIWTGNPERGELVAMLIDSGTVWVNRHLDLPFDVAFGGAKQSGLGRQQGIEGLLEFTQAKIINIAKG